MIFLREAKATIKNRRSAGLKCAVLSDIPPTLAPLLGRALARPGLDVYVNYDSIIIRW